MMNDDYHMDLENFRKNGYKANSKDYKKGGPIWKSIFAYNRSDNYVMAVLELTEEIRKRVG